MVRVLLQLRFVLLVAVLGAVMGALVMFGLAGTKLVHGAAVLLAGHADPREVTGAVMGAIDALLFGVVLIIFASAIAFGFVFDRGAVRAGVPGWMRPRGIGELKRTLVEVILVYLIVDFATDLSLAEAHPDWTHLVVPVAVALIAGAMRLLPAHHEPAEHGAHAEVRREHHEA